MSGLAGAALKVTLSQARPIPLEVELSCASDELLAVVGPSGSGKSTLLRCIAGLQQPQSGQVQCGAALWFDSASAKNLSPQDRRVGMMFQHYALFPHLSAVENVIIAMGHLSLARRRERASELFAMVNMEGLEERRPNALSGGQQQRVALARALARDPSVLLLDEPFSAVDQLTRRRLRRELAQLRRRIGIPVLLVTHDLDEAQALADSLCVLHHGKSLQLGPTQSVLREPIDAEVARLVDHRNVFRATVERSDVRAQRSWVKWASYTLECSYDARFAPGDQVDWLLPQSDVVLHRRDRPSRGEHENPIYGSIQDMVILGDDASIEMAVEGAAGTLSFSVSIHVARRNKIDVGERIGVSLLASGIHLMPAANRQDASPLGTV